MKARYVLFPVVMLLGMSHPAAHPGSTGSPMLPSAVRETFLQMLDRPRVPLAPRLLELRPPARGVIAERLDFASQIRADGSTERVPALVVKAIEVKPGDRLPAVIVLHGTGSKKEQMWPWLEQLARRGFLAIAIDGRYHGERIGQAEGTANYNEAIIRAWRTRRGDPQEHPFYYDNCWDAWRTIDYLETRADVDASRIGMIGISKGGIETWLAAAVDERVKVAIPAISVQSFRYGLDNDHWQARANTIKQAHEAAAADLGRPKVDSGICEVLWAKLIPGIRDIYDGPSMIRLFAGRPLLILNGEKDPNCPIEGAEHAFEAARIAFREVGAEDRLKIDVAPGSGHTVTPKQHEAALDWCVNWLHPNIPDRTVRFLRARALRDNLVGPPAPRPMRPGQAERRPDFVGPPAPHPAGYRFGAPVPRRPDFVGPPAPRPMPPPGRRFEPIREPAATR